MSDRTLAEAVRAALDAMPDGTRALPQVQELAIVLGETLRNERRGDRVLSLSETCARMNWSRTTLYRRMNAGLFPRFVWTGTDCGWLESEVDAHIATLPRERPANPRSAGLSQAGVAARRARRGTPAPAGADGVASGEPEAAGA